MTTSTAIAAVRGREILDSRGRPTVEADVVLADGSMGRAAVPSGASTGASEACELRDGDPARYGGLGVRNAVAHVNAAMARAVSGMEAVDQRAIDVRLLEQDGTPGLTRLGANAVLAVSLATCRAAAAATDTPLYRHIAALAGNDMPTLPVPMVNMFSGGMHAGHGMDVQDVLAIPARAASMDEAIHSMARVRAAADTVVRERGLPTLLADEGGLSPGAPTPEAALDLLLLAIERAGLMPGVDVVIALDLAASGLRTAEGQYRFARLGRTFDADALGALIERWAAEYPIASVEDPLGEEDWAAWATLSQRLGARLQIVGDDLFTTNPARVRRGIAEGVANGVLVKLNQNGTLSGTLDVIALARAHGYATIVSARSGETEDAFMADLAVGTGAGQIKIGSLRTSSTVAKYNQLLRIAEQSGAGYAGIDALRGTPRAPAGPATSSGG